MNARNNRPTRPPPSVHLLSLNVAIEAFDAHGLRGQNDRTLDVPDMVTILSSLYETISVGRRCVELSSFSLHRFI